MRIVCQLLWAIRWQTKWRQERTCRSMTFQTLAFLCGGWGGLCAWWSCRSLGCACILRPKLKTVRWYLWVLSPVEWLPNDCDRHDHWSLWWPNQQIDESQAVGEPNANAWYRPSSQQGRQWGAAYNLVAIDEHCERDCSGVWWLPEQPYSASRPCQRTPSEMWIPPWLWTTFLFDLLS